MGGVARRSHRPAGCDDADGAHHRLGGSNQRGVAPRACCAEAGDGTVGDDWGAWVPLMQLLCARTPQQVDARIRRRSRGDRMDPAAQPNGGGSSDSPRSTGSTSRWRTMPTTWAPRPASAATRGRRCSRCRCRCWCSRPPLDLYNPAEAARSAAQSMPRARFVEIPSAWGHQSASAADSSAARLPQRDDRPLPCCQRRRYRRPSHVRHRRVSGRCGETSSVPSRRSMSRRRRWAGPVDCRGRARRT